MISTILIKLREIEEETSRRWLFVLATDGSCSLERLRLSSYGETDLIYDFKNVLEFLKKIDDILFI